MKKLIVCLMILGLGSGCSANEESKTIGEELVLQEVSHAPSEVYKILQEKGYNYEVDEEYAYMISVSEDFYFIFYPDKNLNFPEKSAVIGTWSMDWTYVEHPDTSFFLLQEIDEVLIRTCRYDFIFEGYAFGETELEDATYGVGIQMGDFPENDFCPQEIDNAMMEYSEWLDELGISFTDMRAFLWDVSENKRPPLAE